MAEANARVRSQPVDSADGHVSNLTLLSPADDAREALLWLPALGVGARHYLPLAEALAARGIAVALHEWRGLGTSNRRAARQVDWGYRELLQADIPASDAVMRAAWPRARRWFGGHSLGGQLAALAAALANDEPAGVLLVASGDPYWRSFRPAWAVRTAYGLAPMLAALCGHFPGRALGFGGREARGVIIDWARSGRTGRYVAAGLEVDLEAALAALRIPVRALRMPRDWLGPSAAIERLLGRTGGSAVSGAVTAHDPEGNAVGHFSWMRTPGPVADWVAAQVEAIPAPALRPG